MKILFHLLAAMVVLAAATTVNAQDSHYWTNQYGNQARLLGGQVVGTAEDVSAVFYNPGRLALVAKPELLLAGTAYTYSNINLENAAGEGYSLSSSRLENAPSLLAGEIPVGQSLDNRLAYSFLTRSSFEMQVEEWFPVTTVEDIDTFDANLDLNYKMTDYWAGLTWSRRLGDHFGLGISGFVSVRDQRSLLQAVAQLEDGDNAGLALQREEFEYKQVGVLAKIGLGADFGNWQGGLTVTTPTAGIHGSGSIGYIESYVTSSDGAGGPGESRIVNSFQEDREAGFNTPWSSALGLGYSWKSTKIHVTSEYFAAVSRYAIMEADPIEVPDLDEVRDQSVYDHREAVLNYGIGVEHGFNERLKGYLSYRTDYSAGTDSPDQQASISIWDLRHVAAGITFPVSRSTFTVGAIYAYGKEDFDRNIGLLPPNEEDLDELSSKVVAKYSRQTFVLGFSIGLGATQ